MRQEPSYTAATMALQRAFESDRPSGSRLFCDPYAEAFTSGPLRFLARASRLPLVGPLAPRLFDLIGGPGPRPSAVARTRLIDDIASEGAPTVSQVVILGAGFDTRAHRLPALAGVPVFEVDHPATQAAKRSVVESLGLSSAMVTYVAVDFERQSLEQQLRAAGLRTGMSTLFIWEGVTNYLSDSAVDETLLSIGRLAGPGGVLVFTYVDAGVLDGSVSFSAWSQAMLVVSWATVASCSSPTFRPSKRVSAGSPPWAAASTAPPSTTSPWPGLPDAQGH
jgi:methyltransferase (TIGR00027 family)